MQSQERLLRLLDPDPYRGKLGLSSVESLYEDAEPLLADFKDDRSLLSLEEVGELIFRKQVAGQGRVHCFIGRADD